MELNKRQAYLTILAIWAALCLLYQSIWIFSRTATAEIYAVNISKNRRIRYRIDVVRARYTVNDKIYDDTYLNYSYDLIHPYFKVRYLLFAPDLSRSDDFASNWGPLVMFFIVMGSITSIAFIRRDIISDQAVFVVQTQRPFIAIKNNQIEDYDEYVIEHTTPDQAEQALKEMIRSDAEPGQMKDVCASVYKFNSNAIGIFVVYMVFFFWFFYSLLAGHIGYSEMVVYGAILLCVPLYVQNTNNPVFKAKIPDEGSLVFARNGVRFKDDFYAVENIDSVVVYLEAFRNFKYRERVTMGNSNTTSPGDNNKISFRCLQEVVDFTFILSHPSDYWALKYLMTGWSEKGMNVLLQKVFEDDFIIQEMVHFKTPYS